VYLHSTLYKTDIREEMQLLRDEEHQTYAEIAAKYGISRQRVAQMIGRWNPYHFQYVKPNSCVYVGLRNWMNEHRVSRAEIIRRMGLAYNPTTAHRFACKMCGNQPFTIDEIEFLLHLTGLTYEQAFGSKEKPICTTPQQTESARS